MKKTGTKKRTAGKSVKKSPAVDRRLVKELSKILADQKGVEVLGHLAVPAYCCGNGTVALVKVEQRSLPAIKRKTK